MNTTELIRDKNPFQEIIYNMIREILTVTTKDDKGMIEFDLEDNVYCPIKKLLFNLRSNDKPLFDVTFQATLDNILIENNIGQIDTIKYKTWCHESERKRQLEKFASGPSPNPLIDTINSQFAVYSKELQSDLEKEIGRKTQLQKKMALKTNDKIEEKDKTVKRKREDSLRSKRRAAAYSTSP